MNRVAADLFICKFFSSCYSDSAPKPSSSDKFICSVCLSDCVFCVVAMRFMGDSPSRGLTEHEAVSTFLKVRTRRVMW